MGARARIRDPHDGTSTDVIPGDLRIPIASPPKGATGRAARTFPVMARALRTLPEAWLTEQEAHVWVWSDLHLGHENIIGYCNRPYTDARQMDSLLLNAWAETVDWEAPDTALVCVGDVAMKRGMTETHFTRIATMPGRKILVPGNHDIDSAGQLRIRGFDEVCAVLYADGDPKLVFTHVPLEAGQVPHGWVNIHGHLHHAPPTATPHINVSVEQLGYAPVLLSRIRLLAGALARGEYPEGRTTLERIAALENRRGALTGWGSWMVRSRSHGLGP